VGELHDILRALEPALGSLSGEPEALDGGITNRNYRVRLGGNDYVVRQPGKDTDLLGIDRAGERQASDAAAALGIGPAVVAALEDCLVTRFVDCRSVNAAEVAARAEEIAGGLRAFHDCGARLPSSFWVAALLERYAAIVARDGGKLPEPYAGAMSCALRIQAALRVRRPSPCHNDLLPGNIVRERSTDRMMLVDWEYAAMGDARFDLGNLAVNNDFDDATEDRLLRAYHGEAPSDAHRAALKLMRVLSDIREAAWGVVQGEISALDFDFAAYAGEHFERMHDVIERGSFEDWLDAAAAA